MSGTHPRHTNSTDGMVRRVLAAGIPLLGFSCQLQHTIVNFFANIPAMCSSYSERQYRFYMRCVLRATPALP